MNHSHSSLSHSPKVARRLLFACLVGGLALTGMVSPTRPAPAAQIASPAAVLVKQKLAEKNHSKRIDIELEYPQLKAPLPANGQKFNQLTGGYIAKRVADFKKDAAEVMKAFTAQELNGNWKGIDSYIGGGYDVIHADARLISIHMMVEQMVIGNAHPWHQPETFNYDLAKGREVTLAELFKPGSDYLDTLSRLARVELRRQDKENGGYNSEIIDEGTKPKADNFKRFTLGRKGLTLVFEEYQVAPYVAGPQSILIPYASLRAILAPGSVVQPFL